MDFNYQTNAFQIPQIHSTPFDTRLLLFKSPLETDISLNGLNNLIKEMKNEKLFSNRLTQAKIFSSFLLGGLNNNLYHSCVISIISILSDWVREFKYELKTSYTKERLSEIERLISFILSICQHYPLTISELKTTKIGKSINKLAKNLPASSNIKVSCNDTVAKWRKLYDEPSSSLLIPTSSIGYGYGYDGVSLGKKTSRPNEDYAFEKDSIHQTYKIKPSNEDKKSLPFFSTIKKSCIKKSGRKYSKKKQVKFLNESIMKQIRIFKLTDEPNAPEVSSEEYIKIQQELLSNPNKFKIRNIIREKDIKMDKPLKTKAPMIPWSPLKRLASTSNKLKCNSLENKEIERYCSHILSTTYFNSIPEPKEVKCVLFSYEDELIPKIENSKEVSPDIKYTNKSILETSTNPIIRLFNYIESFNERELKIDDIHEIYTRLEEINDVPKEKKLNIIKSLCYRINPVLIADLLKNNQKQIVQNGYQYFPLQDNHQKLNQTSYSIPSYAYTNNNNNNNTTHDSYNSNDSIDNQERCVYNETNIPFNSKIKNMFNDLRSKQPNNLPKTNNNQKQNKQVISPLHYSFIQQQMPKVQPLQYYDIDPIIHNNISPLDKHLNKVSSAMPQQYQSNPSIYTLFNQIM